MTTSTKTGGREATQGVIPGRFALSVGKPPLVEPRGFKWTPLTSVARLESGHTPSRSRSDYWDGDIPWVGIKDATANHGKKIFDTAQHVSQSGLDNSSARLLPAETVCLSRTASVGYVVTMGVPMATSQDFVNWICGPALSSRYLHYVLLGEQDSVRRFAHGTTHQTMYYPEAKALHVLLPPRPVQDAVAEVLAALDDKIAGNERLGRTADELAATIYDLRSATTDMVPMSAVLSPVLGGTPSRARADFWHGAIPWASAKDIAAAPMGVVNRTAESITDAAVAGSRVRPLPEGAVILTARGTVGAVARLSVPASFNQSCYGFVPGAMPAALLYLSVKRATERAREMAHGSVFDTITMATLDHLVVPDPASSEFATLDAQVGPLLKLVEGAVAESTALVELRDTLLPELMSGRLRVKDAEQAAGEVV